MRLRFRTMRRRGFGLIEVMTVTAIVSSLQTNSYQGVRDRAVAIKCQHNLKQIALVLMTSGALPNAAFYPKGDPKSDPQSLRVLLKQIPGEMLVCPSMPAALKEKGLTFLWNDQLNGKSLLAARTWVLIEMSCLAEKPVAPHSGNFHILYTDGSVKSVSQPPKEIREMLSEARAKLKAKKSRPSPGAAALKPKPPKGLGASPLQVGDRASIAADTKLYIQGKVVGTLKRGLAVEILDMRKQWVGVKAILQGTLKSGWVKKSDVRK